jgi:hypothetical protein
MRVVASVQLLDPFLSKWQNEAKHSNPEIFQKRRRGDCQKLTDSAASKLPARCFPKRLVSGMPAQSSVSESTVIQVPAGDRFTQATSRYQFER